MLPQVRRICRADWLGLNLPLPGYLPDPGQRDLPTGHLPGGRELIPHPRDPVCGPATPAAPAMRC